MGCKHSKLKKHKYHRRGYSGYDDDYIGEDG